MNYDTRKKSMLKSLIWRIIGIFWLALITWIFTRSLVQTSLITFIHHGTFLIVFYLHERAWLKIKVHFRRIYKALTYEIILGNLILGFITYAVTGEVKQMTAITLTYIFSKLIMYYFYEKAWERKIVYAYVVADILHIGHIKHLLEAKKQGDYLIVGVLTDKAVMEKKPKPTITCAERMWTISALQCVDEVIPQHTYSPLENIKKIKPDILMESDSHTEQPANDFVKSYKGKVFSRPYYKFQSSTKIKQKICKNQ